MIEFNRTVQAHGFAWYVSPVGALAARADGPFDLGMPRACETPLRALAYWPVGMASTGVLNADADAGAGYLVLTVMASPPAAGAGWAVEPARLDVGCMADGGNLRVVSIAGASPGGGANGPRSCVFEVSEG